ncbi:MAG TPA: succinylglutamate desuccinylase/aspartoacylase family protein [Anaerolineae bacterium]|nr:succinylglutamate desuccinylase/aspartoacylase family protein [Anaerolineae bacterium]
MTEPVSVGTAKAERGTIQYGRWGALGHPTGNGEFLPIILAQGKEEGPCLWLTAGIHGPEQAGPAVLYRLITQELVDQMRGTIVAIPALNPAGLRMGERQPHHAGKDPNRLWPDGKPPQPADPDREPPTSLERAYKRLYDEIVASADYLIDYHNAWTGSIPFSFRDRVLYRGDGSEEEVGQRKAEAEALSEKQEEMLRAFGLTIVREFPAEKYIEEDLHRSTSAAVLLLDQMPAFTVELGTGHMPDAAIVRAAVAGTRNVMRWAGMLRGEMEPIEGVPVIDSGYPVRRCMTPRVEQACVVLHLVEPGDIVQKGDPVAEVRDVWGRPMGDGLLRAEYDGFVMGRSHGIYYYPGNAVLGMAVRDEAPLVAPYPADFFQEPAKEEPSSEPGIAPAEVPADMADVPRA